MDHEIAHDLTGAHRNMERVLTLIQLQVDSLRDGSDAEGWTLLRHAIGYMRNYPGVIHHPVEELIIGKLIRHAPEARTVCARLQEQHQSFRAREATLLRRLDSAERGDTAANRQLRQLGTSYCTEHANHIRSEEMDLFPSAVRWLNAEDWGDIERRSRDGIEPKLESSDLRQFDNLYDYLMTASRNFSLH